ncbi:SE1832 family protein [Staphylococcus auricularis]|uniref:SE1832 family protein n=1 Tax=Staphylococcus auricularis TaxID=29379 RepID=UPI003EC0EDC3
MDLKQQLTELKQDYVRLQDDLDKRESTGQDVDPLIRQLEAIEQQIAELRSEIQQKEKRS